MDEKQAGGSLLIYAAFCLAMIGIYAWSMRRSQQIMRDSLEELNRIRAQAPVPQPRRVRPKANGNGSDDNG